MTDSTLPKHDHRRERGEPPGGPIILLALAPIVLGYVFVIAGLAYLVWPLMALLLNALGTAGLLAWGLWIVWGVWYLIRLRQHALRMMGEDRA